MKYPKDSIDYRLNLDAFHEMEQIVPMTLYERNALRHWAQSGHNIDSNPWDFLDEYGYPLNYLQAYRLEYGYSSGPWDFWRGPDAAFHFDYVQKRILPEDEY